MTPLEEKRLKDSILHIFESGANEIRIFEMVRDFVNRIGDPPTLPDQKLIDDGFIDGKKSFEYFAKEIHDDFNWIMVHRAMIANEWYWALGKDEMGKDRRGIPCLTTIKNYAYELLRSAYNAGTGQISSGGFTAGWDGNEMFLTFTLEETSA